MGLVFGCSTIVVVISLISLAGLIIATITGPAVSSLGLAEAGSIRYGALGYCSTTYSTCVLGTPSYMVSTLTKLTDWKMDDNARDTLAKILIVTPIAAGLTLISLFFNLLMHFRSVKGSFAFSLIGFLFTLLAFFGTAITVIVVFMLFYPHVLWPAWLLIASGVLSLIAVPLAFFALRTSPSSSDDDQDLEDDAEDKNLTDLTDGDHFKSSEAFHLNDYPAPQITKTATASSHDKNDYSAIKVITDDSSFSHDYEKVSLHDISKNNGSSNYRGYDNYNASNGSNSALTHGAYAEGTPNLVSSQNYNKGGAIRSEAPTFEPQSAKPEFGTTPYPTAQYSTSQPRTGPLIPGSSSNSQVGSLNQRQPQAQSTGNVLPNDRSTSLSDDLDYDAEIVNDDDSDFTSVSQRAANPRYYGSIPNNGPSLFPQQQQQQQQQQPGLQQQAPLQNLSQQQSGYANIQNQNVYDRNSSFPNYSPQQYQNPTFQPQQSYTQQGFPQQSSQHQSYQSQGGYSQPQYQSASAPVKQPRAPARDTSSALLNANPDFSIGPGTTRPGANKRISPASGGSYKPAYRRAQNPPASLPAASLSADSPYNFR